MVLNDKLSHNTRKCKEEGTYGAVLQKVLPGLPDRNNISLENISGGQRQTEAASALTHGQSTHPHADRSHSCASYNLWIGAGTVQPA
jgi:hypothetical protein